MWNAPPFSPDRLLLLLIEPLIRRGKHKVRVGQGLLGEAPKGLDPSHSLRPVRHVAIYPHFAKHCFCKLQNIPNSDFSITFARA